MTSIHDRIRRLREDLGISLSELGEKAGVSWQAVQQWENGKTSPKRDRVERLAKALSTTVLYIEQGILSDDPTPAPDSNLASEPIRSYESSKTITMPQKWPFHRISIERLLKLSSSDLAYVEGRLAAAIEECESTPGKRRLNAPTGQQR